MQVYKDRFPLIWIHLEKYKYLKQITKVSVHSKDFKLSKTNLSNYKSKFEISVQRNCQKIKKTLQSVQFRHWQGKF